MLAWLLFVSGATALVFQGLSGLVRWRGLCGIALAGGLGLGLTGAGLWQAGKRNDDLGLEHTGDALMLAGLGALITGAGLLISAQTHLWDAINLYNEEVIDVCVRRTCAWRDRGNGRITALSITKSSSQEPMSIPIFPASIFKDNTAQLRWE